MTIVDNAPAGIVFDTEDSAGCTITVGGNLSCTFAHLGAGASETVNVTYHVPSTTDSGTVTNTATADSDEVLPVSDSDDLAVTEDVIDHDRQGVRADLRRQRRHRRGRHQRPHLRGEDHEHRISDADT